ncbi:hypothetical protein CVT26_010856 [Gymnopilus dilepis]|uniref:Uncharacterized protein n=1 Tax=Gymnopilus dilepis TaxID=231916 RepID=A0A409W5C6_9AGAR|nr:hypothetical protein CVT26_010856 [Gymnopilus dilepis]
MEPEFQPSRAAKPQFLGQNGFISTFTEPDQINERNLEKALEARRMGDFMIQYKKRDVPDLETMKADVDKPPEEDLDHVNKSLEALREYHTKDLENFYAYMGDEYLMQCRHRSASKDPSEPWIGEGPNLSPEQQQLEEIYEAETTPFLADFKSHFNHIRYTYLTQLLSLEKAKQEHEANLEKLRRQREQMFPQSTEEWASKPHDVRLRVARFLVADDTRKEKFMSDFGWAWRQVTPLVEEFKKNEVFAAEVRGLMISEQAVKDPRLQRAT